MGNLRGYLRLKMCRQQVSRDELFLIKSMTGKPAFYTFNVLS